MREEHGGELPNFEALSALIATSISPVCLRQVADGCKPFTRDLRRFHPIRLAAAFGGLLLKPSLQSNCVRLEALVQLSMALADGDQPASSGILLKGFSSVGRTHGSTEDPPEDVFVGNVVSSRGNFLVLEGTWESGTFYLQRFIDMVDELPDDPNFQVITECVYALLTLSDLACRRAGLTRNQKGSQAQEKVLPTELARQFNALQDLVEFSLDDLKQAGVIPRHLAPFTFEVEERRGLLDQAIGNTDLERFPVAIAGRSFFLVLPTAVSGAIRRFFIEVLGSGNNREIFVQMLAREYMHEIQRSRFLRGLGRSLGFGRAAGGYISCVAWQVDHGRPVVLLCLLDTLDEYEEGGLRGLYVPSEALKSRMEKSIAEAQEACAKNMALEHGLVLMVTCGVGRGVQYALEIYGQAQWQVVHLAAADMFALESMPDMSILEVWRILDGERRLKAQGVHLQNINGFLNLAAWGASLDGHLIPHTVIPPSATGQTSSSASDKTRFSMLDIRLPCHGICMPSSSLTERGGEFKPKDAATSTTRT